MSSILTLVEQVGRLDPEQVADRLVETQWDQSAEWLNRFSERLDQQRNRLDHDRAAQALKRTLAVWNVTQSAAAQMFGVSRQAFSKWLERGVPGDRATAVADLAAATDLLVRHIRRDRIAAVVRRPAPALDGHSLLDTWSKHGAGAVLQACRDMFSFENAQG